MRKGLCHQALDRHRAWRTRHGHVRNKIVHPPSKDIVVRWLVSNQQGAQSFRWLKAYRFISSFAFGGRGPVGSQLPAGGWGGPGGGGGGQFGAPESHSCGTARGPNRTVSQHEMEALSDLGEIELTDGHTDIG